MTGQNPLHTECSVATTSDLAISEAFGMTARAVGGVQMEREFAGSPLTSQKGAKR